VKPWLASPSDSEQGVFRKYAEGVKDLESSPKQMENEAEIPAHWQTMAYPGLSGTTFNRSSFANTQINTKNSKNLQKWLL
jgi:hypothetical protein